MAKVKYSPISNSISPIFNKKIDYSKYKKPIDNFESTIFNKRVVRSVGVREDEPSWKLLTLERKEDIRVASDISSKNLFRAIDFNLIRSNFIQVQLKEDQQTQKLLDIIEIFRNWY